MSGRDGSALSHSIALGDGNAKLTVIIGQIRSQITAAADNAAKALTQNGIPDLLYGLVRILLGQNGDSAQ